ncbi:MAG: Ni/Fe hydrogenase subunit alpha [Desulfatibacillaceae bacterium]|nr:Ni/Fe hydrogenase subunit alpha [Desulfatibacillaceae bacterium]
MSSRITINPITRLEGHGKIEIFLDDSGNVEDAYWQVTELRGFEVFCLGRPAQEMTRIAPNICGVCPSAHHMAATKALDALWSVEPPLPARLIRELEYNAFFIEDHFVHFFFLAAPDLLLGPETDPALRNILGVVGKLGREIGEKVIDIRKKNRDIIRLVFGKAPHPEGGLPGGVPRAIRPQERDVIRKTADQTLDFAQYALTLFKDVVLNDKHFADMLNSPAYKLDLCSMALVDEQDKVAFYDGKVAVCDVDGTRLALFDPKDYASFIAEHVEPWTFVKLPFLKERGWKGLTPGQGTSLYRVGPLARLNVAGGMATPFAQQERDKAFEFLGGRPLRHTLAFHWARLICALMAAERNCAIANTDELTSRDIRNMNLQLVQKGIGCVEAPRGILFHHYETDEKGILTKVNLVVATQHNAGPICLSVKNAAQGRIKNGKASPDLLNEVEMAFRAYDPCLACATHSLPGRIPIKIAIRDKNGCLLDEVSS